MIVSRRCPLPSDYVRTMVTDTDTYDATDPALDDLRTKLGKGRELPEEPSKPKRVPKPKAPVELGPDGTPIKKPPRAKKAKPEEGEDESLGLQLLHHQPGQPWPTSGVVVAVLALLVLCSAVA